MDDTLRPATQLSRERLPLDPGLDLVTTPEPRFKPEAKRLNSANQEVSDLLILPLLQFDSWNRKPRGRFEAIMLLKNQFAIVIKMYFPSLV